MSLELVLIVSAKLGIPAMALACWGPTALETGHRRILRNRPMV